MTRWTLSMAIALAVAACQAAPPTPIRHVLHEDGGAGVGVQPAPAEGLGTRWTPTGATASSSVSHHVPAVAIDGNLDTFWDSGEPSATATITLAFAERRPFRWLRLKTGPLPDSTSMKVMVSDDGTTWNPASGRIYNSTWDLENHDILGDGKYLQVKFFSPMEGALQHFKVHEIEAYGGT